MLEARIQFNSIQFKVNPSISKKEPDGGSTPHYM
jgi:hypothetical protein